MDISEKQAVWREQKPLFEAEFIHSHLLPFFTFNENTGDYEIKSECVNNTDDEDRKVAYEALNTGWVMWLRAKRDAKAQAVPAQLDVNSILHDIDCYFDNGLSNTERTANNLLQSIYEKLSGEVKAQEPAND